MEFKEVLSDFAGFLKTGLKKLILISILIFYFSFLGFYNAFRMNLDYSVEFSWIYGITSSLIFTTILVFLIEMLLFYLKKRK